MSDPDWEVRAVKVVEFDAIREFVRIKFDGQDPTYQFRGGELWKAACFISVFDDGRVHLVVEKHLTPRQQSIVAGLAEEYWRAGPQRCKREQWRRRRRSSNRKVGSRVAQFWVVADQNEPGYAAAQADYALAAVTDRASLSSTSGQYLAGTRQLESA